MHHALIVDDEPDIRELLQITLKRMNIDCACAPDLKTARELLRERIFDVCLTDMRLPDGDGVEFVSYLQQKYPRLPVAVITAHGNMETAIQALKSGAFDFLNKPVDLNMLRTLIDTALRASTTRREGMHALVGCSAAVEEIREKIAKLARSQAPVYISGESGVGKELVARMIHEQGPRSAFPFVPVNCGAIPQDLMESELFGHRKGSFTGATSDRQGLFQAAEGGTLFLDEVGELAPNMQVKLLRAIQEKKIRPVGEQQEVAVNVRILSATHRNLARLVQNGAFREDLFYRINVIELHVPPLRERGDDIPLLVDHILDRIAAASGSRKLEMTAKAMALLQAYPFPGNVRELENILERASTLSEGREIRPGDLQLPAQLPPAAADAGVDPQPEGGLEAYLGDVEKRLILKALEQTSGNRTAAAKLLGISFRQLRYKLKKLGLD
jgi:two-component system response regulator PilR (NtrC family)